MTHFARLAALLCLFTAPVHGATLTEGGDTTMGCSFTLTGPIDKGDSDTLYDFISDNFLSEYSETQRRLCLDSPGGSYVDGVRIGRLLTTYGIGAAVADGARCESACAIAFMGGAWTGEEGAFFPDRTMHPGARVGFHAPSLTLEDRSYSKDEIDAAYGVALIAMSELMQQRKDSQFAFPDSLLLEMMATPPNAMRYVETVLDAAQWNIAVWPVELPADPARTIAEHACHNGSVQIWDEARGAIQRLPQDFVNEMRADTDFLELTTVYAYADNALRCRLRLRPGWAGLHTIGSVSFPSDTGNRWQGDLHTVLLHAPDTMLADLAPDDVPFDAIPALFTTEVKSTLSCTFPGDSGLVSNVNEFVNMRAEPSFGAEVMRRVAKAELVTVLGSGVPRIVPPNATLQEKCEAACAAPDTPAAQLTIQECIAENALWQNVQIGSSAGWISRRFLSAP